MKKRLLLSFAFVLLATNVLIAQVRILTIGDSTMADYDEVKNNDEKEKRGWGQMLHLFFRDDVIIDNEARNGRSSKSFYFERWDALQKSLNPGDYVIIQFGHNDEKNNGKDTDESDPKERGTAPWSQYVKYLTKYIEESREKKANPILVTPVVRRMFSSDGKTLSERGKHNLVEYGNIKNDSILNYVLAMKSVARKYSVPLIDMTDLTRKLVEEYGPDKSKEIIFCHEDNTHLKAMGAILFSKLFTEALVQQNILTEYIQNPTTISISPKQINFESQLISIPVIKAISISSLDLPDKNQNINLTIAEPFSISFNPSGGFTKTLDIKEKNDFHKPVFIRFIPQEAKAYNGHLSVLINEAEKREIALQGIGLSANKDKAVDINLSITGWIHDIIKTEATDNVFTKLSLGNMEYWFGSNIKESAITIADEREWPKGEIDMNSSRYIELSVTAKEDIYINHLSFNMKAFGAENMQFTALGSLDEEFKVTDSYVVMDNMSNKTLKTYSFDTMIEISKGKTYRLRIYPWNKAGGSKTANCVILNNISMKGLGVK